MLRALLVKFLLGRGVDLATELASKGVRHALGAAGGAAIAHGIATADQVTTLEGAGLVLVAIVASAVRSFLSSSSSAP